MWNLSRKGGKSEVRWTGPYSIIVIHEKGLYSLQNCNGKTLAKKINGSRLKLYHERKGNCSNVSSQQLILFLMTSCTLHIYCAYGEQVLLCWHIVLTKINLIPQVCISMKMSPLREVCGGDFVICNDGLHESFMEFKKSVTYQNDLRIVEQMDLLTYWIKTCKITSIKEVSLMDKSILFMSPADLDALCEWVYDTRKQWNKTEMKLCSPTQSKAVTRCSLDEEIRNTVLSSTGWLDDTIINRAQSILREQFGAAGFQNTTPGTRLLFDVIRSEFIQILHNGKNLWLTIPTIGCQASTVNVYDSLYQSLSQCTIDQICALMFSTNDAVDVRFIDVEQQTNNSDCGVYAIAYATSLCFSEDISCIQYCVSKMRSHLWWHKRQSRSPVAAECHELVE
ncbi:hypothetical protein EMCRGX_G005721 [Ephydatia muelleri]